MLIQRVITAAILLPLLLAAVFLLPLPGLFAVFALVGVLMAWEWSALTRLQPKARAVFTAATTVLLAGMWILREHWIVIAAMSLVWWCYAPMLLAGYPGNYQRRPPAAWFLLVLGLVLIASTVLSLSVLRQGGNGVARLLYLFFLIFAADTGAYFSGRRFGRRKLAPAVSPGKTVEGAMGGLAACAVWALVAGNLLFHLSLGRLLGFVALSLIVAALSVIGDLFESLLKRAAGVKDSGRLLPGHGGILDRVDSLMAAAPTMALGLYLLEM